MRNAGLLHRLQQGNGVGNVVAVVLERLLHRFANLRVRRKMHDGPDRVLVEYLRQKRSVTHIAFNEITAGHQFTVTARQVIQCDYRVTGAQQVEYHVRANVAGTPNNQDCGFPHINWSASG